MVILLHSKFIVSLCNFDASIRFFTVSRLLSSIFSRWLIFFSNFEEQFEEFESDTDYILLYTFVNVSDCVSYRYNKEAHEPSPDVGCTRVRNVWNGFMEFVIEQRSEKYINVPDGVSNPVRR